MAIQIGVKVDNAKQIDALTAKIKKLGKAYDALSSAGAKSSASSILKQREEETRKLAVAEENLIQTTNRLFAAYNKTAGKNPFLSSYEALKLYNKEIGYAAEHLTLFSATAKSTRAELYKFAGISSEVSASQNKAAQSVFKYVEAAHAEEAALNLTTASLNKYMRALGESIALQEKSYQTSIRRTAQLERENAARRTLVLAGQDVTGLSGRTVIGREALLAGAAVAAQRNLTREVHNSSQAYTRLGSAVRGAAGAFGKLWLAYGELLPMLGAFAAAEVGKQIITKSAEFEYTTKYIDSLRSETDKANLSLEEMRKQLLSFSDLRIGPNELAEGMKEFAKAGVDASTSLENIAEMAKFASVGEIGLSKAIELVIGQANAFGVSYSDAANMISAAALSSSTSIEQMATAFTYTTPLASAAGMKFEEVAAALAVLANAGIRGSKAGTALTSAIIHMQNPTDKLYKKLDKLGISWSAFTDKGKVKNLQVMFSELNRVTKELPDEERVKIFKELFQLRALKGAVPLIKEIDQSYGSLIDKIKNAPKGPETFLDEKYAQTADTLKASFEELGVAWESLITRLGSGMVGGALSNIVAGYTEILNDVSKLLDKINAASKKLSAMKPEIYIKGERAKGIETIGDKAIDAALDLNPYTKTKKVFGIFKDGYDLITGKADIYGRTLDDLNEKQRKIVEIMLDDAMIMNEDIFGFPVIGQIEEVTNGIGELSGSYEDFDAVASSSSWGDSFADQAENAEQGSQSFLSSLGMLKGEFIQLNDVWNKNAFELNLAGLSEQEKAYARIEQRVLAWADKNGLLISGNYELIYTIMEQEKCIWDLQHANKRLTADEKKAQKAAEARYKREEEYRKKQIADLKEYTDFLNKYNQEISDVDFAYETKDLDDYSKLMANLRKEAADWAKDNAKYVGDVKEAEQERFELLVKSAKASGELERALIASARAGDDFVLGFNAGIRDMQDGLMTLGEMGYATANDLREALGDSFTAALKGDWESLGDIWDSVWDNILDRTGQYLADRFFDIGTELVMSVADGMSSGGGVIGDVVSGLGDILGGVFSSGKSEIKVSSGGCFNLCGAGTADLAGKIGDTVSTAVSVLSAADNDMFNAVIGGLSSIDEIPEALDSGLGELITGLGGEVSEGVSEGLSGSLSSLASTVADVAGLAAGAYGMYSGVKDLFSGNVGTGAIEVGLGGYSAYQGAVGLGLLEEGSFSAAIDSLTSTVSSVAAEAATTAATTAATEAATAGMTNWAADAAALNAAESSMLAGGSGLAALAGPAALAAIGGVVATEVIDGFFGEKSKWDTFTTSTGDQIDVRDAGLGTYGNINQMIEATIRNMSGSTPNPQDYYTEFGYDKDAFYQYESAMINMQERIATVAEEAMKMIDVLAQGGDQFAVMATKLDGTIQSTDAYIDALAGHDVALAESQRALDLAASAAGGNADAMMQLQNYLIGLGVSSDRAGQATMAMINAVNKFSSTPLNLDATARLKVEVEGAAQASADIVNSTHSSSTYLSGWQSKLWGFGHASGGIFNRPTYVTPMDYVGEAGYEAVTPLPYGPNMMKDIYDSTVKKENQEPTKILLDNHIVVEIDGKQLDAKIISVTKQRASNEAVHVGVTY